MPKALIGVVGNSGTGKSTSLRNLPPDQTVILDGERKGFPFIGSKKFKRKEFKTLAEFDKQVDETLVEGPRFAVIESLTRYFEILLEHSQRCNSGYEIYKFFNRHVRMTLNKLKNEKTVWFLTAIDELVKIPQPNGAESSARRIWVPGKEHEGKIEKELLMVFFTEARRTTKDEPIKYCFMTNTDGICSAKSPMGMFAQQYIDNDLNYVVQEAIKYYAKDDNSQEL